jgi:hypothetical protein
VSVTTRTESFEEDDACRDLDPTTLDLRRASLTVDHHVAVPVAAPWTDWGRTDPRHAYWDHVACRWRAVDRTDGAPAR